MHITHICKSTSSQVSTKSKSIQASFKPKTASEQRRCYSQPTTATRSVHAIFTFIDQRKVTVCEHDDKHIHAVPQLGH